MPREMYPTGKFVDDATRQRQETEMEVVPEAHANSMLLRASQTAMTKEALAMAKSLYLRQKTDLRTDGHDFIMKKFDVDQNYVGEYALVRSNASQWTCSCPARRIECRHAKMMPMFERAESGSDEVYNELQEDVDGNKYVVFLVTDNKSYKWIRGPQIDE